MSTSDTVEVTPTVVHVVEPRGAGCGPATLARVASLSRETHAAVVVVGNQADAEHARRAGCTIAAIVPLPLGSPRLAAGAIRRLWRSLNASSAVAWSERAAVAITGLAGEVTLEARIAAVAGPMVRVEPRRRARVSVCGIGTGVGEVLARRGWRVGPTVPESDLPEPSRVQSASREELRRRWNAKDDEAILVASADPPELLDMLGIYTVGLIAQMKGRRFRLVTHPDAGGLDAAHRFSRELKARDPNRWVPIVTDSLVAFPTAVASGVDLVVSLCRARAGRDEIDSSLVPAEWAACGVETFATRSSTAGVMVLEGDQRNDVATRCQAHTIESSREASVTAASR